MCWMLFDIKFKIYDTGYTGGQKISARNRGNGLGSGAKIT